MKQPPSVSTKAKQKEDANSAGTKKSFSRVVLEEAQASIPVLASTKPLDLARVEAEVKIKRTDERKVGFSEDTAANFRRIAPALSEVFESLSL